MRSLLLTDTQLVLLSAASQRDDGLVVRPDRLKGGAAKIVAEMLVAGGLAEEAAVAASEPHWRGDQEGTRIGLKITAAGLYAIGVTPTGEGDATATEPARRDAGPVPREGTKQALILSLLQREQGVTLDELVAATQWLPHTARAALTRLRRIYSITRTREGKAPSVYRLARGDTGASGHAE